MTPKWSLMAQRAAMRKFLRQSWIQRRKGWRLLPSRAAKLPSSKLIDRCVNRRRRNEKNEKRKRKRRSEPKLNVARRKHGKPRKNGVLRRESDRRRKNSNA